MDRAVAFLVAAVSALAVASPQAAELLEDFDGPLPVAGRRDLRPRPSQGGMKRRRRDFGARSGRYGLASIAGPETRSPASMPSSSLSPPLISST